MKSLINSSKDDIERIENKLEQLDSNIKKLESTVEQLNINLQKHIRFIDETYDGLKNPINAAKKWLGR